MNDLLMFLTSKEIMIVYIISASACIICLTVYFLEKNNERARRKHNTKELNKLVEMVKERVPEKEEQVTYDEPILEPITESSSLDDLITNIKAKDEEVKMPVESIEEVKDEYEDNKIVEENIEYTSLEPDKEEAKEELIRLENELIKENKINNIELTKFEEEQEKTAIISLDELLEKSRELYELNEITQYQDDGNEPISLQDLERKMDKEAAKYDEPFIIANVVSDENGTETVEVIDELLKEKLQETTYTVNTIEEAQNILTVKEEKKEDIVVEEIKQQEVKEEKKVFKSTPFISPIFGIERENNISNDLALENTANYEKLDEEIKKTNNFVMSLKELQEKLD